MKKGLAYSSSLSVDGRAQGDALVGPTAITVSSIPCLLLLTSCLRPEQLLRNNELVQEVGFLTGPEIGTRTVRAVSSIVPSRRGDHMVQAQNGHKLSKSYRGNRWRLLLSDLCSPNSVVYGAASAPMLRWRCLADTAANSEGRYSSRPSQRSEEAYLFLF